MPALDLCLHTTPIVSTFNFLQNRGIKELQITSNSHPTVQYCAWHYECASMKHILGLVDGGSDVNPEGDGLLAVEKSQGGRCK